MKEKDFNNKISEGWFSKKTPEEELRSVTELYSDYIDELIQKARRNQIDRETPDRHLLWDMITRDIKQSKNKNLINHLQNINMYFATWPEDNYGDSKADINLIKQFINELENFQKDFLAHEELQLKNLQSLVSTQSQTSQPSTPQQQPKQPQQQPKTAIQPSDKDVYGRIEPTLESIKHLAGLAK